MLYNKSRKRVLRDFALRTMSGRELSSIKQMSECTASNPLSFYIRLRFLKTDIFRNFLVVLDWRREKNALRFIQKIQTEDLR